MARVIAVTGKGGTGKSTVSALIIRHLKLHAAGPVLALDADPDSNLATLLGIPVEKTVGDLREDTAKEIRNLPAGMSKSSYLEMGLHEIIVEGTKVDLMAMGRSEGPGCYCYVNNLLRDFSDKLQYSYDWIVMDNEAGMEHLSRRTAARIDHLVVVVNENPLSLDCARRIDKLATDLRQGVTRKLVLINAIRHEERVARLRERLVDLDMEFLGFLPHDPVLEESVFEGQSLLELDHGSAIVQMDEIMNRIKE